LPISLETKSKTKNHLPVKPGQVGYEFQNLFAPLANLITFPPKNRLDLSNLRHIRSEVKE